MKITIGYYLEKDIEIDDARVNEMCNGTMHFHDDPIENNLCLGDAWNLLAQDESPALRKLFDLSDGGEITCVLDEDGMPLWES